jgi:hypothetical protein
MASSGNLIGMGGPRTIELDMFRSKTVEKRILKHKCITGVHVCSAGRPFHPSFSQLFSLIASQSELKLYNESKVAPQQGLIVSEDPDA